MMDFILEAWVSSNIERAKVRWMLGGNKPWQPGEKLKLLFAGYNGTRNMGSDVRVDEMLRQIRHILGAERDESELRILERVFRGHEAGAPARYFPTILVG
jgi:hypothetical protein